MGGVEIADRDDNNSSTRVPYLAQLPSRFTMDEFAKYNPYSNDKNKTFNLTKSESFRMIMDVATFGKLFDTVYYPVNPANEAMSVVQQ